MDANILKTAISSIIFVAEEDIQKINAFDPTKTESYSIQYLLSIANIARNVSKSFKGIESLVQSHIADISGIDKETMNRMISVATDLAESLTKMINENPANFLKYIDFQSIVKDDKPDIMYGAVADARIPLTKAEISVANRTVPIYGVTGLYDAATALTRTDDAVGMSYTIDRETGSIRSDFDNVFPWNKTKVVDLDAGKFVSFPEMYFRIGVDEKNRITDVAVSSEPSGAGKWYKVEPFMYGCYGASIADDQMKSVSGVERAKNFTRKQFRDFAMQNGDGYLPIDLYHRNIITLLWLIEWATKDSASIMTGRIYESGKSGGYSRRPTGGTDNVATPSGFEIEYGQMRYHNIEDFIGNVFEIIDGICMHGVGQKDFVTADPDNFGENDEGKKALSFKNPKNGEIAALGWDENNPFLFMPIETVGNGDNDTYFCNEVYHFAGNPVARGGAYFNDAYAYYGLFYVNTNSASYSSAYLGSRLLYKS